MTSSIKVAVAAISLAAAAFSSAQQIKVQVDGTPVYFANTQPQYINGRVLVPLRGVFEEMGANVLWNQQTHMVTATRAGTEVELKIGSRAATINGAPINLDVPAMVLNGSTMVPIRFVSEALGAQVGWLAADRLVTINTTSAGNAGTITTPPRTLRRILLTADQVIPIKLDHTLSSDENSKGDTFTATVIRDSDYFADIPQGTKIEGHIAAVHGRKSDTNPAILDLAFDRMRFPNGRSVAIDGSLISLDDKFVRTNDNGVLVARSKASTTSGTDNRMVYAGYGAGAGLLVGVLTKRPLEGAILGGALGYILGQVKKDQGTAKATESVTLVPGTTMGVRLNHDVAVSW
jgi:hypothetical protein